MLRVNEVLREGEWEGESTEGSEDGGGSHQQGAMLVQGC